MNTELREEAIRAVSNYLHQDLREEAIRAVSNYLHQDLFDITNDSQMLPFIKQQADSLIKSCDIAIHNTKEMMKNHVI